MLCMIVLLLTAGVFSSWRLPSFVEQANADSCYRSNSAAHQDINQVFKCRLDLLVAANVFAVAPLDRESVKRVLIDAMLGDDAFLRRIGVATVSGSVYEDSRYGRWVQHAICQFARTHRVELSSAPCLEIPTAQRLTDSELRALDGLHAQVPLVQAVVTALPRVRKIRQVRVLQNLPPYCQWSYWMNRPEKFPECVQK